MGKSPKASVLVGEMAGRSTNPLSEMIARLLTLAEQLESVEKERKSKGVSEPLRKLRDAANEIGRSWGGGWLGYHSRVYYTDFQPTPPGAHFSTEFGLEPLHTIGTVGDWSEYTCDGVREAIFFLLA
jgi:hypothetical protein